MSAPESRRDGAETAFGYDIGGDYRFRDGVTTLSGDIYTTTLQNHFLSYTYDSGTVCPAIDPVTGAATPSQCAGKPLFYTSNRNLADASTSRCIREAIGGSISESGPT